jgi:hypothetical protein
MTCVGLDVACFNACKAKGCLSAQNLVDAILTCGIQNCTLECLGGFSTGCVSCITTKCSTQYQSCQNNAC